jgi:RNA polymerase sigma-70 factor, ECF subfamily
VRRDRAEQFERCFDEHWSAVCRCVARRGAGALTEDLAAEAFSIAWRKWRRVPEDPLPWLLRTAINLLANARRAGRWHDVLDGEEAIAAAGRDAHSVMVERDDTHDVLRALATLPDIEREALILTVWDQLTSAQAAAVCGCSPGAFRVRLHRARAALKAVLASNPAPATTEVPSA